MAGKQQYTAEQMIDALRRTNGIQAQAARLLGCHRRTVANYIDRYVTVRQAYEEARDTFIDAAEAGLQQKVKGGDLTAIMFVLKTIGKHRGYTTKSELEHSGTGPQEHVVMSLDEWKDEAERRRQEVAETMGMFDEEE